MLGQSSRPAQRVVTVLAGVLAVALLATVLAWAATPTAAQGSSVTVTNATVEQGSPTAGETFVVRARIANSPNAEGDFDLRSVHVETPDGRSNVASDLGTLSPGSATTVRIPVTVDEPGWHDLTLDVRGIDRVNSVVTINHPIPVQVQGDRNERISMSATADDLGQAERTDLHLTVANGFDHPISGVELHAESDDLRLPEPQRVTSQVLPGNVTQFTLPARDVQPGQHTVGVTFNYTAPGGDRHTARRNLTAEVSSISAPGRIVLTELDVTRDTGQLAVRGSASNVGTTDVSGVVISVEGSETAGPAEGAATFFVGEVPASDFSSFDVAVAPRANGTITIPLEVSYVTDGVRTNRTVEVTHRLQPRPDPGAGQSDGGGFPLLTVIGALVLVGGLVVGWRRYRG